MTTDIEEIREAHAYAKSEAKHWQEAYTAATDIGLPERAGSAAKQASFYMLITNILAEKVEALSRSEFIKAHDEGRLTLRNDLTGEMETIDDMPDEIWPPNTIVVPTNMNGETWYDNERGDLNLENMVKYTRAAQDVEAADVEKLKRILYKGVPSQAQIDEGYCPEDIQERVAFNDGIDAAFASQGYLRSKQDPSVTKAIKWLEEWFYGIDRSSELEAEDFEDFDRVIAAARSAGLTGGK